MPVDSSSVILKRVFDVDLKSVPPICFYDRPGILSVDDHDWPSHSIESHSSVGHVQMILLKSDPYQTLGIPALTVTVLPVSGHLISMSVSMLNPSDQQPLDLGPCSHPPLVRGLRAS